MACGESSVKLELPLSHKAVDTLHCHQAHTMQPSCFEKLLLANELQHHTCHPQQRQQEVCYAGQSGVCPCEGRQAVSSSAVLGRQHAAQGFCNMAGAACWVAAGPCQGGQGSCCMAQQSCGCCLAAVEGRCHIPAGAQAATHWRPRYTASHQKCALSSFVGITIDMPCPPPPFHPMQPPAPSWIGAGQRDACVDYLFLNHA